MKTLERIQALLRSLDDFPEIAQNTAGLHAVVIGSGIIATWRGAKLPLGVDDMVSVILDNIVDETLSATERSTLLRLANTAGPNFACGLNVFDLLDPADVDENFHWIRAAAIWLRDKLK